MGCVVIAGVSSSVGKTTVAVGIMDALRRRGLKVQPFKVGPDYIDPGYHTLIVKEDNRQSRNLDSWMIPPQALLELFSRAMRGADIGLVEGVMGLYDGYSSADDTGSTAQVAKLLGSPVILVIDVSHTSRSAAATVLGFKNFDTQVDIVGVVLNFVGSTNHLQSVTEAITNSVGVPVVGYLSRHSELVLPERHLGLIPTAEKTLQLEFRSRLASVIEANFNIDYIETLAKRHCSIPNVPPMLFPSTKITPRIAIGVAHDEAFNFYYQDNLDLLEAWGAEIIPISPIHDTKLPARIGGLYFGGGFPEYFALQLAENKSMMSDIKSVAGNGMPLYAECGGLMYLSQGITDFHKIRYPMVGLIPGETVMTKERLSLGYAEVEARFPNFLMDVSERARGHEFHYSRWDIEVPKKQAPYKVINKGSRLSGFIQGNILASYIHLHFASNSKIAPRFVESCFKRKAEGGGII